MGLTQSLTKTPRAKPVVSPSTPLRSAQDRLRRTTIPPFEKGGIGEISMHSTWCEVYECPVV